MRNLVNKEVAVKDIINDFANGGARMAKNYAGEHADELRTHRQQAQRVRHELGEAIRVAQHKWNKEEAEAQSVTNATTKWEKSQSELFARVMGYVSKGGWSVS